MTTVTVALPDDLANAATKAGLLEPERFAQMLRDRMTEDDALREAIRSGDESGPSVAAGQVFSELRAELARVPVVSA